MDLFLSGENRRRAKERRRWFASGYGPPSEPLEAYPLESLKYVGVMTRKISYALIQVDGALYQVRTGNYLGQNFGVITQISESEIVLKELVQDSASDWIEKESSLLLQGQEGKK